MLKTCNVYGEVYAPDGVLARNCIVRFIVAHRKVSAQYDKTIVPRAVIAATDGAGLLSWVDEAGEVRDFVPLAPGGYEARLFTESGEPFAPVNLGVPDEPSIAFAAIIDVPPPTTIVPGPKGDPGAEGLSAYEIALNNGFEGTEEEWLASLVGPAGSMGAEGAPGVDGSDGQDGAPGQDGADGKNGEDGRSAYQVAVASGFVGTEGEWLASLVGPAGERGADGAPGLDGSDGQDGAPGRDGTDGRDGADAIVVSFATDAEAEAYSAAHPGAAVFSRQGA